MTALLRRALITLGVLGSLLAVGSAGAGQKSDAPVTVSGRQGQGALGSARNTSDGNQWIGCDLASWGNAAPGVSCYASTSTGASVSCYSTQEVHIKLVQALPPDGFLKFISDANGYCRDMDVQTTSFYPPKKL